MKDNNLSAHLKELICAGVTSLKIEGRLKDKEYVTNVVSYYRQAIDSISKTLKASEGEIITSFVPNPDKTFNRGYTNFYFDGKRKKFINEKKLPYRLFILKKYVLLHSLTTRELTSLIEIVQWCNGSTTDSGPVSPGSSPG